MYTKCPFCNTNISSVEAKNISINTNMHPAWNGIAYTCPNFNCNAILSVGIDEIALKSDIIEGLFERLKK